MHLFASQKQNAPQVVHHAGRFSMKKLMLADKPLSFVNNVVDSHSSLCITKTKRPAGCSPCGAFQYEEVEADR